MRVVGILLFVLLFVRPAQALSLSEGCFRGKVSNGSEILVKVTRLSEGQYRVIEQSELNFGPYPYWDFDYTDDYEVSLASNRRWFYGKQGEVRESFSVFGSSRVVLTPLTGKKVRYHRTVKYHGPENKNEIYNVDKVKGTLVRDSNACANLQ